ncbi:hypothetical protein [Scytonema sp. PCC 10023]|uniref:hypothetical protein n=1 Tax=Scytonema sp. PCC 10023 TaxID=1680591 RepID=UPI0039C6E1EC
MGFSADNLNLPTKLIVLCACETARGRKLDFPFDFLALLGYAIALFNLQLA